MGYLAPLFLITIAYVTGLLIQSIFCDNDGRIGRSCLVGTFFLLLVWEAVVLLFDYFGLGFELTKRVYSAILCGIFIISLFVNRKFLVAFIDEERIINKRTIFVILGCLLAEGLCYYFVNPDISEDMTVETINTIITTNSPFGYNPLTGKALESSLGFVEKVGMFPVFYAYVKSLFGTHSMTMVYRIMPLWTVCLEFLVFSLWSDMLFDKDENKKTKAPLFIAGVTLLNILGAFSRHSLFYYITLRGFSGESVFYAVIVPYIIYESFYGFNEKKKNSMFYVFLAVMAGFLTVDAIECLVTVSVVIIICIMINLGIRIRRYIKCRS